MDKIDHGNGSSIITIAAVDKNPSSMYRSSMMAIISGLLLPQRSTKIDNGCIDHRHIDVSIIDESIIAVSPSESRDPNVPKTDSVRTILSGRSTDDRYIDKRHSKETVGYARLQSTAIIDDRYVDDRYIDDRFSWTAGVAVISMR